jgi:hypothetical protein
MATNKSMKRIDVAVPSDEYEEHVHEAARRALSLNEYCRLKLADLIDQYPPKDGEHDA